MRIKFFFLAAAAAALGLAACSPKSFPDGTAASTTTPTPHALTLTPFQAMARPTTTHTPVRTPTDQALPSPTPTPRTHIVARGEDMFGIALRYGITIDELKTANPEVNPNFLSIGGVLEIPAGAEPVPTAANPTPTPLPLQLSGPDCWPSGDGGLTCIVLASNPGPRPLENLAVRVRVAAQGGEIIEQEAFGLLDQIPPGQSLPALVFFPELADGGWRASVELLRAFALPEGDARYAEIGLAGLEVEIAPDGSSARVTGRVSAVEETKSAWVAAWGLDAQGRVVAARRWETNGALESGGTADFSLNLYSLGDQIVEVKALAEGKRP